MSEGDKQSVMDVVTQITGDPEEGFNEVIVPAIIHGGATVLNQVLDNAEVAITEVNTVLEAIGESTANQVTNVLGGGQEDLDADLELNTGSSHSYVIFNPFKPQTTSLPLVYGTRDTPGVLIHQETNADPGENLWRFYAISDSEVVDITARCDPASTNDTTYGVDTYYKWRFRWYNGSDSGADYSATDPAFEDLRHYITEAPSWTTSHTCKGVAVAFHRFVYDKTEMPNVPKVIHTVQGRSITGNDDNPANQLYDYLTNTRYGAGISSSLIDTTAYETARDYCDAIVATDVKRFTSNIILNNQNSIINNVRLILSSCMGQLQFRAGKYYMHIDSPLSGSAVFDFDTTNLIGGIGVAPPDKGGRFNQAIVTYFDSVNEYKPAEAIWPNQTITAENTIRNTYLSEDDSEILTYRVSLPGVTSFLQARYIAKIKVLQSRKSSIVSLNATADSAECVPGDIVTLTWSALGWSSKQFVVRSMKISPDIGINLTLQEHDDAFYTWDSATSPSAISSVTIKSNSIDAVSSLTATEEIYSTRDGAGVKTKVTLSWDDVDSNFLDAYEIQYKLSSASTYQPAFDSVDTSVDLFDFGVGTYDFKVVTRAIGGIKSSASTTSLTTDGLSAVPSTIENLFVNSMGTMALLQWDISSDLDVRQGGYYQLAHSVDTSANTWSQGVRICKNVAGQQTSVIAPLLAGTYMIRAVDSTGQNSMPTYVQSTGSSLQQLAVDSTVTEETSFSGTKNRVSAVDDMLKIESEKEIDSVSDFDNIVRFDAIDGIWNTSSSGYSTDKPQYDFANQMDLGSVKTTRLRIYIQSASSSVFDTIDTRVAYIDTWTDFDNTDTNVTSVRAEIRSTDDDPASGSATWGDWSEFYVEERSARGHEFRIFPETTDSDYNIQITQLRTYAETLA